MSGSDGLGYPIDVMYLIHKALRVDAARVVAVAKNLETGDSLQSFKTGVQYVGDGSRISRRTGGPAHH